MQWHGRRGMALYLAAGLAFLVGIFVLTYYEFMRSQTMQAHLILEGERALCLARAGTASALAYFMNSVEESPLREVLVKETASACNEASAESLEVEEHPALKAMLEDDDEAELSVELSLTGFRPMFARPESDSGIVYNQREKFGWLRVWSRAQMGKASRELVTYKALRVISTLPYVVGKFTLFEIAPEAPGENAANLFQYEKTSMQGGRPADGNPGRPVVLHNGAGESPEERGWVFLGGGQRVLNLSWGRLGDGDEFQLLERPWKVTSDPTAPQPLPPGYDFLVMQKGFFRGIKADNDLYDLFDFAAPAGDPVTQNGSVLRLYGDGDLPSPTYVLGQVQRRFLSLRYLMRASDQAYTFLPWAPPGGWGGASPAPWQSPPPWDVRSDTFGDDRAGYEHYMSGVQEEAYNRGADYVVQMQNEIDLPRTMLAPQRVRHRFNLPDYLYRPAFNNGEVQVRDTEGERLFDGNLHGLLARDFFFAERATYSLPASSFPSFLELTEPRVPGILYFTGGDVTIDRPLRVLDGGVIAVDGKITIAAPVEVTRGVRPLVLASLTSDVVIATEAPVRASIMALAGRVEGAGQGLDVTGNIVSGSVDWPSLLSPSRASRLVWNPRLDPTDPDNRVFDVHMSPGREAFMP